MQFPSSDKNRTPVSPAAPAANPPAEPWEHVSDLYRFGRTDSQGEQAGKHAKGSSLKLRKRPAGPPVRKKPSVGNSGDPQALLATPMRSQQPPSDQRKPAARSAVLHGKAKLGIDTVVRGARRAASRADKAVGPVEDLTTRRAAVFAHYAD